jgi:hypothetical protein
VEEVGKTIMDTSILNWLNVNSSAITALSIFGAGLVWFLKMPLAAYREEILSIAKWEKLIALNEVATRDNINFMQEWLDAIEGIRPYSCHFETLLQGDINTMAVGDLKLTNQLLRVNYMMKRSSDDLNNVYENYWKIIPTINEILEPQRRKENLDNYHANVSGAIKAIKESHQIILKEMLPILAKLQVAGNIRSHSIFAYAKRFFLIYIWPRPSEKRIKLRIKKLQDEMKRKGFSVPVE